MYNNQHNKKLSDSHSSVSYKAKYNFSDTHWTFMSTFTQNVTLITQCIILYYIIII